MKRNLLFLTMFLSVISCFSQPIIQWQKTLGGSNIDVGNAIIQTTDGGYIVAVLAFSTDGDFIGNYEVGGGLIVKLDASGTIQWQKVLDGGVASMQLTSDGGYIVAGVSSTKGDAIGSFPGEDADYYVVKLKATGEIQWQKTFGGSAEDWAGRVQQTTDGGYIVAGSTESNNGDVTGYHGNRDCWIVKLNATGTIEWQKSLGGSADDGAASVQQTADGGYIVSGGTASNNGDVTGNHGIRDYWVVKLNATGVVQWQKTLGGSAEDWASSVQQTTDGGYIVAGRTESTDGDVTGNHGDADYWVVKLNATGAIQWQKALGGSAGEGAGSVQQTTDGGYIVAGLTYSSNGDVTGNHGDADYWIVKLNTTGAVQWQKTFGGSAEESPNGVGCVQQTTDGGYIIAGGTKSNNGDVTGNHGVNDCWVVKLAADHLATPSFQPGDKAKIVIFPNPTSDKIRIQFGSGCLESGIIKISDLTGKIIFSSTYQIGDNNIEIDTTNLNSGIFLLTVQSTEFSKTEKIVVVR